MEPPCVLRVVIPRGGELVNMCGTDADGTDPERSGPENSDGPCGNSAESYEGKWRSAGRSAGGEDHARRRLDEMIEQRLATSPEPDKRTGEGERTDVPPREADPATGNDQPD
jgi:hypothetical protein